MQSISCTFNLFIKHSTIKTRLEVSGRSLRTAYIFRSRDSVNIL